MKAAWSSYRRTSEERDVLISYMKLVVGKSEEVAKRVIVIMKDFGETDVGGIPQLVERSAVRRGGTYQVKAAAIVVRTNECLNRAAQRMGGAGEAWSQEAHGSGQLDKGRIAVLGAIDLSHVAHRVGKLGVTDSGGWGLANQKHEEKLVCGGPLIFRRGATEE